MFVLITDNFDISLNFLLQAGTSLASLWMGEGMPIPDLTVKDSRLTTDKHQMSFHLIVSTWASCRTLYLNIKLVLNFIRWSKSTNLWLKVIFSTNDAGVFS